MVLGERPQQAVDVVRRGIETFQALIGGVTAAIRAGDGTIKDLDSALTGRLASNPGSPEESFLEVVALMQAAAEEARQSGSATSASVVQRAREMLARATREEPAWRPAPSVIRTANDVFRTALRDLRASQNLLRLAQGTGSLDDLEQLSAWAGEVTDRLTKMQQMIAQPKPGLATTEANPTTEPNPAPAAPTTRKRRKKSTTPKASPEDIAFARAVAEELGDAKVKSWAQEFADGRISEKQWISRLTSHAASSRETLDDVFARAQERMARDAGAN